MPWFDRAAFYMRPAAAIADLDAVVWELTSGGVPLVRLLSELPFGSTTDEQAAWTRYEAIVNRAFQRSPLWAVCLYDTRNLPPQVVGDASRTHQAVWEANRRRPSPDFVDPAALLREIPEPAWTPVGEPTLRLTIDDDQHEWRHQAATAIAHGALPHGRVQDLLVAVTEVVANALQHGDNRAQLALWVAAARLSARCTTTGADWTIPGRLPATRRRRCRPGHGAVGRQAAQRQARHPLRAERTVVRLTIGR